MVPGSIKNILILLMAFCTRSPPLMFLHLFLALPTHPTPLCLLCHLFANFCGWFSSPLLYRSSCSLFPNTSDIISCPLPSLSLSPSLLSPSLSLTWNAFPYFQPSRLFVSSQDKRFLTFMCCRNTLYCVGRYMGHEYSHSALCSLHALPSVQLLYDFCCICHFFFLSAACMKKRCRCVNSVMQKDPRVGWFIQKKDLLLFCWRAHIQNPGETSFCTNTATWNRLAWKRCK